MNHEDPEGVCVHDMVIWLYSMLGATRIKKEVMWIDPFTEPNVDDLLPHTHREADADLLDVPPEVYLAFCLGTLMQRIHDEHCNCGGFETWEKTTASAREACAAMMATALGKPIPSGRMLIENLPPSELDELLDKIAREGFGKKVDDAAPE